MCGIVAVYGYSKKAKQIAPAKIEKVRDAMVNRGPDGADLWIDKKNNVGLGHRRLSIIDLTEAGTQPMASPDRKLQIVFNGEIYNYKAIRQKLIKQGHKFISDSDTEVILHLYREKGANLVHDLRGMYAFSIWDLEKKGLFLARDPFGIKPLYFFDDGNTFWCASQVKALLASGEIPTTTEPAGLVGFYLWGNVPEPYTLYQNIWSLPAGHTLWIDQGGAGTPQQYFSVFDELSTCSQHPLQEDFSEEFLGNLLRESVKHHLVADVPVGVFLSSGLDSTVLAALSSEFTPHIRAVTLGFNEYLGTEQDEVPLARRVAEHYGFEHSVDMISRKDFDEELDAILTAMDQPSIDGVNTYFVARAAARAGLKVVISGLGGDELFGSYPSFQQIPSLVRSTRFLSWMPGFGKTFRLLTSSLIWRYTSPKYASIFEYGDTYGGAYFLRRGLYMPWELLNFLDAEIVQKGWERLQPVLRLNDAVMDIPSAHAKISALEMTIYMRNMLLRDADWAGMAHSLEIRVPFVDIEVFKSLAPLIVADSVPEKRMIAFTPIKKLPNEIAHKPKTGFSIPVKNWIDESAGLQGERGLRGWAKYLMEVFANYKISIKQ